MVETRSRAFSKLAKDVDTSGNITTEGIASDVELGGGVTVYASAASLPISGNTAGDQAFVTGTGRLYIFSGVGWYNIALINNTPIIQSVLDSDLGTTPFILANDGTATTITITAVDSDGETITYASSADSDFSGLATISQSSNVFTITPFSQDSATTSSGTITFTATDGINTATSATQTFTLNFVSSLWDETILSIGTSSTNGLDNSTFIDRSTNAHTVTTSGSPIQTTFNPYLDNWSVEFPDGANKYLQVAASNDLNFGTGDFTIECWYYHLPKTASDTDRRYLIHTEQSWNGTRWILYTGFDNNKFSFYTYQDYIANSNSPMLVSSSDPSPYQWHHIALTRSGNTFRLFINGVLEASSTRYTGSVGADTYPTFIGGGANQTNRMLAGIVSNIRIVKGTALYTSAFTPPTEKLTAVSGTSLLTCQSNRFIDNSSSDLAITIAGDPVVSAFNPFGQESEYAAGENKGSFRLESGDWVQSPSTSQSSLSYTQDWTIEFWAYMDNDLTSVAQILFNSVEGTGSWYPYIGSNIRAGGQLQTQAVGGEHLTTGYVNPYEWFHVALVHDYSANELKTYLNGTLVQTLSKTFTFTTGAIRFNSYTINTASNYPTLGGHISDFRWTIGSTVYTSDFTPPTAPVGNTNAGIYVPFDNSGIFDKTGNHTLTLLGDAATSATQTKFANTAMSFDGSGDGVFISEIDPIGTSDFTIEGWFNTASVALQYQILADYRAGTTQGAYPTIFLNYANLKYLHSSTFLINGTTTLSANTWYHFALCRSGSTTKMFLNGVQEGSTYSDTTDYIGSTLYVGTNGFGNGHTNGYIENFQILKGVAKYTANFTPPTSTQGRTYQAES